jgi:hypothetical protein
MNDSSPFATCWAESPITQLVVDQLLESAAPAPKIYPAINIHKATKRAKSATVMAEYLSTILHPEDPMAVASVGAATSAWQEVDRIVEKWNE